MELFNRNRLTAGPIHILCLFMSEPIEPTWRHDLILNEIAGLCLNVARDLSRCAEDTDNPERKVKLAGALHQMCRSIRQTLALQARLARHVRREGQKRAEVRKARVRSGLKQLIWTEHEPAETPELEARLERLLDAEPETLAKGSVEAHIQRLSKLLGVRFVTPAPQRTSSSGLSRGPMNAASDCDPAAVPTHLEPSADMDPRDKPAGDGQGWEIPRRSAA